MEPKLFLQPLNKVEIQMEFLNTNLFRFELSERKFCLTMVIAILNRP